MTRPSYRDFAVAVSAAEDVSPTFRRITLVGPDLHECGDELLDQRAPDALSPHAKTHGIAWNPGKAREVLIVGDETGLPAIRNIVNALPAGRTGTVVLDLPCPQDAVGLAPPPGVDVLVPRDGERFGRTTDLVADWLSRRGSDSGPCYAWVAGESGWVGDLRKLLLGSGVVIRARASFMGYWKQGAVA